MLMRESEGWGFIAAVDQIIFSHKTLQLEAVACD